MRFEVLFRMARGFSLLAVMVLLGCNPQSQPVPPQGQGLEVRNAWVRAMPPGSSVAAGYAQLRNAGARKLSVTDLSSPAAGSVEVHNMTLENGQMRMRAMQVTLAPGESLDLAPGGQHLMFFDVASPLVAGQNVSLNITLDDGSSQQISLPVRSEESAAEHVH